MLNGPKSELKVPGIKVEPALCESLNSCLSPPSFQDVEALRYVFVENESFLKLVSKIKVRLKRELNLEQKIKL